MNRLQQLITEKLRDGKSYNRIEAESKVNHVSVAQYHKGGVTPSAKNLVLLADYFRVDFWDLTENVKTPSQPEQQPVDDHRKAVELRLIVDELSNLSPNEQLEWLLRIRKEREARQQ